MTVVIVFVGCLTYSVYVTLLVWISICFYGFVRVRGGFGSWANSSCGAFSSATGCVVTIIVGCIISRIITVVGRIVSCTGCVVGCVGRIVTVGSHIVIGCVGRIVTVGSHIVAVIVSCVVAVVGRIISRIISRIVTGHIVAVGRIVTVSDRVVTVGVLGLIDCLSNNSRVVGIVIVCSRITIVGDGCITGVVDSSAIIIGRNISTRT